MSVFSQIDIIQIVWVSLFLVYFGVIKFIEYKKKSSFINQKCSSITWVLFGIWVLVLQFVHQPTIFENGWYTLYYFLSVIILMVNLYCSRAVFGKKLD